MALATSILQYILIAAALAAAYDIARRWLSTRQSDPEFRRVVTERLAVEMDKLSKLQAQVDENERAFKAVLLDWRARFNELDSEVKALPKHVESKVAGTVAAIGALPSAPKQWR